jgi:hypothetical protein
MPIDDEAAIEMYRRYRFTRASLVNDDEIADFGWERLPENLNAIWIAYGLVLPEAARSLANIINQLYEYSYRLKAWNIVLTDCDEDSRLEYIYEFVDSLAILGLTLPYSIRERFIFSVTQLCHEANKAVLKTEWIDDIPEDRKIKIETMRKYGASWSSFAPLEAAISRLYSPDHQSKTSHFRREYTHRLPTQAVLGYTTFVRRKTDSRNKRKVYEFGHAPPIELNRLSEEILREFKLSLIAFQHFKIMVNEQIARISSGA